MAKPKQKEVAISYRVKVPRQLARTIQQFAKDDMRTVHSAMLLLLARGAETVKQQRAAQG